MTKKDALKIYETNLMGYFSRGTEVPCNACYERAIYIAFSALKREIEKEQKNGNNA